MTIAAISSASANVPPPVNSFRQSFAQLANALQSGNLTAAQSAYAAFTQTQAGQGSGPFAQAISQIGDALQSGDLGKAQQALASLQQQMQAMKGAHHHHGGHHHHDSDGDKSQSATAPASTNTDPTQSTSSTNLVDVTA
jgi:hypothetical protein